MEIFASLVEEGELLTPEELEKAWAKAETSPIAWKEVAKAQAAKSKAIEMSKQRRVGQAIKESRE